MPSGRPLLSAPRAEQPAVFSGPRAVFDRGVGGPHGRPGHRATLLPRHLTLRFVETGGEQGDGASKGNGSNKSQGQLPSHAANH